MFLYSPGDELSDKAVKIIHLFIGCSFHYFIWLHFISGVGTAPLHIVDSGSTSSTWISWREREIYIYSLATSPCLLGEVLFGQPFYEGFGRGSCVEDAVWFYFIPTVFNHRDFKYYQMHLQNARLVLLLFRSFDFMKLFRCLHGRLWHLVQILNLSSS